MRQVKTRVLPEPAPAKMRRCPSVCKTASDCFWLRSTIQFSPPPCTPSLKGGGSMYIYFFSPLPLGEGSGVRGIIPIPPLHFLPNYGVDPLRPHEGLQQSKPRVEAEVKLKVGLSTTNYLEHKKLHHFVFQNVYLPH